MNVFERFKCGDKGNGGRRWRVRSSIREIGVCGGLRGYDIPIVQSSHLAPCGERSATVRKRGCRVRGPSGLICITARLQTAPHPSPLPAMRGEGEPCGGLLAGGGGEANYGAMIGFYIFEENHRFSN